MALGGVLMQLRRRDRGVAGRRLSFLLLCFQNGQPVLVSMLSLCIQIFSFVLKCLGDRCRRARET